MDDLTISATGVIEGDTEPTTVTVDIAVHAGGRIRQITVGRASVHTTLLADPPGGASPTGSGWGSFPMVPWAGRLRHGRFETNGHTVALGLNVQDGIGPGGGLIDPPISPLPAGTNASVEHEHRHAIHGTTFARPWTVEQTNGDAVELSCTLSGDEQPAPSQYCLGWPFPGVARQRIEVAPDRLVCSLSVDAAPGVSFPAAVGWHPWFHTPQRVDMTPTSMYVRDDTGIPTGQLVPAFSGPHASGPWDDCFVNQDPVRLSYQRSVAATVTITSDCDHLVVFDHPEHATCIEPQSGPPDALNLAPLIVSTASPLMRTMTIGW